MTNATKASLESLGAPFPYQRHCVHGVLYIDNSQFKSIEFMHV